MGAADSKESFTWIVRSAYRLQMAIAIDFFFSVWLHFAPLSKEDFNRSLTPGIKLIGNTFHVIVNYSVCARLITNISRLVIATTL